MFFSGTAREGNDDEHSSYQSHGGANPYQKQQDVKNAGNAGKSESRRDVVRISSEAKELAAENRAERTERIQELKRSVSEGTYKVDAHKIAEKLLNFFKWS